MKKLLYKIKHLNELDVCKVIVVTIALLLTVLVFINQTAITFRVNKFDALAKNDLQVYYLDVGQASSTLIVLPNKSTFLIDAGGEETTSQLVKQLKWILNENKLSCIDYFLWTHSDSDHVGGAVAVLDNFQVNQAYRPKLLSKSEENLQTQYEYSIIYTDAYDNAITTLYNEPQCTINFVEDLHITDGKTFSIDVYACEKDYYSETNAYSPFIVLQCADKTFLFTGDTTAAREKEFVSSLTKNEMHISVDFLLVSHHGSKYSTTEAFLEFIQPKYAFISAGDSTHPSQEVLTRLSEHGVENIYVTKALGTIAVGVSLDGSADIFACNVWIDFPFLVVLLWFVCFIVIYIRNLNSTKDRRDFQQKITTHKKNFVI